MNFLGIPLWERHVNGFQKPGSNGWDSPYPVSSESPRLRCLGWCHL